MKTVKKRTVSIIHELIGNEELMTLSELAEKFEVSQRTIRNDLKLINELLKEMEFRENQTCGRKDYLSQFIWTGVEGSSER